MECLPQLLDLRRSYQTHSSIPPRSLLLALLPDQGAFPPQALPGFISTTTPSATPRGRLRTSRCRRWPVRYPQATPRGFPCRAHLPCTYMPSPLPRRNRWLRRSFAFTGDDSLPRISGGPASALPFSRPAQRPLHVTACMFAGPLRTLYIESFPCFVASTGVPIATGWNDSCRVGISPTE
jgi:hypothetical protein